MSLFGPSLFKRDDGIYIVMEKTDSGGDMETAVKAIGVCSSLKKAKRHLSANRFILGPVPSLDVPEEMAPRYDPMFPSSEFRPEFPPKAYPDRFPEFPRKPHPDRFPGFPPK